MAGFEIDQARLDKDFELYYTVSDKDFGLNLLTYRPDAKQDGYFMLLVSPKSRIRDADVIRRDVSFVFDTSGSMSGAKIEQAKRALRHCIGRLNSGDRFNVGHDAVFDPAGVGDRAADSERFVAAPAGD